MDKGEAREFIEHELAHQRTLERRAGASLWALLGALGGSMWLAIGVWETASVDGTLLAQLLICFSLPVDVFGSRFVNWFQSPPAPEGVKRFRHLSDVARRRPAFVYWASRLLLLAGLVWWVGDLLPWPIRWLLVLWYFLVAGLSVLMVVASFFDVPFSFSQPPLAKAVYSRIAEVIFFVVTMLFLVRSVPYQAPGEPMPELRLAALAVLASVIVFGILWTASPALEVTRLVEIRRRLVLGRIDPTRAILEAEWAVAGQDAPAAVTQGLWELAELQDRLSEAVTSAESTLAAAEDLIPHIDEDPALREQCGKLLGIAARIVEEAKSAEGRLTRKRSSVQQRIAVVTRASPESIFQADRTSQLQAELLKTDLTTGNLQARLQSIDAKLNSDQGSV